jgi:hypothetical protein
VTSLRLLALKIGVTHESFHLSGKPQVDIALLKIRQRSKANVVAQFFKIIGGIPSGQAALFVTSSKSARSTSSTEKWKGGRSKHGSVPGSEGTHSSFVYVCCKNRRRVHIFPYWKQPFNVKIALVTTLWGHGTDLFTNNFIDDRANYLNSKSMFFRESI